MEKIHFTLEASTETQDKDIDNGPGNPEIVVQQGKDLKTRVVSNNSVDVQNDNGSAIADELEKTPMKKVKVLPVAGGDSNLVSIFPSIGGKEQNEIEGSASQLIDTQADNISNVVVVNQKSSIDQHLVAEKRKPAQTQHLILGKEDACFKCSACNKLFKTLSTLNNHFKTHSQGRPHTCKDCSRSFKQMSNLIQHRRIHTGERPYGCSFCEKSFKQKSQVMQHERLHTGEKPYVCSYCQRAFVQLSQVKYHEQTHRKKEAAISGDQKYTKSKRRRKRNLPEILTQPLDDVSPVYILTEEDIASGTISAKV